jgi:transposase InsO family protein
VQLRLIESGKPNQNAYLESFNGRFRDECLNAPLVSQLASYAHQIETWRWEYNEDDPKRRSEG